MMTQNTDKKREQIQMFCMDDLVPQDHLLRLIDKAIDWSFIYDLVEDKYCLDNGRPSLDPVVLIKIPFIQYLYGIKSMRQTIKDIEDYIDGCKGTIFAPNKITVDKEEFMELRSFCGCDACKSKS